MGSGGDGLNLVLEGNQGKNSFLKRALRRIILWNI